MIGAAGFVGEAIGEGSVVGSVVGVVATSTPPLNYVIVSLCPLPA
jgi:hypothetical protein